LSDDSLTPRDPLDELVARCVELMEQHGEGALADFCRDRPAEAEAVRERIDLLRRAGLLGGGDEAVPERLGEFRLIRRLGSGGMGVVYLAEQEPLGRLVALKLVRPNQLYFPGTRERFRREVEAAARLEHPGIVAIHTVGEASGIPYFAMAYVPGCTLAAAVTELASEKPERLDGSKLGQIVTREAPGGPANSPWPADWIETCVHVGVQLADALAHAHQRGVIHRDIKPSNVLLTAGGTAQLVDFGLAKLEDASGLSRSGQRLGTPFYMSPEQVANGSSAADARADVYGLGVVLYEMLTLRVPFPGESEEQVYRAILTRNFPAPSRLNPEVDADLQAVVLRCLEHDPADRYSDAASLASDLRRRQRGEPTMARPSSAIVRQLRSVNRWSALALLVAAGVVLTAWVLVDGWLHGRSGEGEWVHGARLGLLAPVMLLLGWLTAQGARKQLARRKARWVGVVAALALGAAGTLVVLEQRNTERHARALVDLERTFNFNSHEALRELERHEARWGEDFGAADLELATRILLENGRPTRANELAERLSRLEPDRPAVHALLLITAEALGDDAIVQQEQGWLDGHPLEDLGWRELLDLGTVLAENRHADRALEAYRTAGQQTGVDRDRLDRLMAEALMHLCRFDEAASYLEPVLLWHPQMDANALLAVRLATARRDWARAEEYLGRLTEAPFAAQFDVRIEYLDARGNSQAADTLVESAISQHADDASLLDRCARRAFRAGKLDQSRLLYEKLLTLSGSTSSIQAAVNAHVGLSATQTLLGQFEEAERNARAAIELEPDSYEAHFDLAEARGQRALAAAGPIDPMPLDAWRDYESDLRTALACHALMPQALNNLAFVLGALHRADPAAASLDEARKLANRALQLMAKTPGSQCSDDPATRTLRSSTWATLAGLNEQAGDLPAALAAARQALDALPADDAKRPERAANVQRLEARTAEPPDAGR
jgi:serine/threonine protein kinase